MRLYRLSPLDSEAVVSGPPLRAAAESLLLFLGSLCTSFLISPTMPPPTSSSRCVARFNSGLDGQPREGNIKQKGSEFSPSLLPFTWFGNTLSCVLFRATRLAGKAGHKPAAWPEDLGPYTVPYLKWKRSRLITGHILVRGQGEPQDLQSRIAIGMIVATIQRPAKQLRLRCGLGERRSGSLLEFQPLFCCNF